MGSFAAVPGWLLPCLAALAVIGDVGDTWLHLRRNVSAGNLWAEPIQGTCEIVTVCADGSFTVQIKLRTGLNGGVPLTLTGAELRLRGLWWRWAHPGSLEAKREGNLDWHALGRVPPLEPGKPYKLFLRFGVAAGPWCRLSFWWTRPWHWPPRLGEVTIRVGDQPPRAVAAAVRFPPYRRSRDPSPPGGGIA